MGDDHNQHVKQLGQFPSLEFNNRRSPVYGLNGMVACSQPAATNAGVDILKQGGNAVDAAIAIAAALSVTEPCSTGIGGDCFILYYDAVKKECLGINGSGRSPSELSLEKVTDTIGNFTKEPIHALSVTVPGAVSGWLKALSCWGSLPALTVLSPAIKLAKEGFAVAPLTAHSWSIGMGQLMKSPERNRQSLLIDGKAPSAGEIFRNLSLAERIQVLELPPNGQGLATLLALNFLRDIDIQALGHNTASYLHHCIEAMRLAFQDARRYIGDPDDSEKVPPLNAFLSEEYAKERRALISPSKRNTSIQHGIPLAHSDTVSFQVVDAAGNAVSMVNSNYMGFGTGLIPLGEGFTLQNRGACFSCDPNHPNCVNGGMTLENGDLHSSFSLMGGFMQPQGHLQILLNQLEFGMNPQEAIDAPRFCISANTENEEVSLEEGICNSVCAELYEMGHPIVRGVSGFNRQLFGRSQIIRRTISHNQVVLVGGSDGRGDGCAFGF
ncbi:putative gamma-glutamyltransferase YwrD [Cardiosporidium cionae]|uniref:Gamma-glutamyltransferase YwrD n=1 Tax=Cardiosporidium cionae TaxID=476202 RepID=A0ABQ7JBZ5_9APIC|nr:putative gamma-glutamyltransferase YwrD [Cardiosporidium cionae]|eukprot:KAF8821533.1 putative gamma-glutamyltransferase YwrD [Cardiosporidium cionae]